MLYRLRNIVSLVCVCLAACASAQTERMYRCELGLQGGCGYYVGDATEVVFQDVREAYGLHFRYKFDQRWALQIKGLAHHIRGNKFAEGVRQEDVYWETQMVNVDVMGEFNFFRFGKRQYDTRIKPITPYIGLGVGASVCMDPWDVKTTEDVKRRLPDLAVYMPFVVGVKWKFADRWQLQLAWQHNVYFADNLEGKKAMDNPFNLNGSNLLNNDVTSQITFGIVFEFAQDRKICNTCNY